MKHHMKWEDVGIIIHTHKLSETKVIVTLLTKDHGRHKGVIRKSSKDFGKIQLGNIVFARWNARLSDHIGLLSLEVMETPYVHVMQSPHKLQGLSWVCGLLNACLPERHVYEKIYDIALLFLENLQKTHDWQNALLYLEMRIIQDLGYGFDVSTCALCGNNENLTYLSPKTGRAACDICGKSHANKILTIPHGFIDLYTAPSLNAFENAMKPDFGAFFITTVFLKHIIFENKYNHSALLNLRDHFLDHLFPKAQISA